MKLPIVALAMLLMLSCVTRAAESDADTEAHRVALDVAGAFSNEGFKVRDGHWTGLLKPGEPVLAAVNLYAGNQYWFSAGAEEKAKKLTVKVFDETGKFVTSEPFDAESRAAAGFSPTTSGQYFVAVEMVEGEAATCCLLYSYK